MDLRIFSTTTTLFFLLFATKLAGSSYAQVSPPITSSGLGTQVNASATANGETQFNITGGTRPGGGENLFHSFGNFNVPNNNIANFLNNSGLATSNILGRVTGGNPSSILGTIQTTGFGNANLFLMNPAGIVFGPTASLNVGGAVTFTTANHLRLVDNRLFDAFPSAPADTLLSAAPVAAFGFSGSNAPGIAIQGSTLKVPHGQTLSLVSGNQPFTTIDVATGRPISVSGGLTISESKLSAQGGQINLVSVVGPGEVLMSNFEPTPPMTLGNINLSQGTIVTVSGNAGGTVRIRGGNLVVDNTSISANSTNANGASIAIDIKVAEEVRVSTANNSAFSAKARGTGGAGAIEISSARINVTGNSQDTTVIIDSHTSGAGKGGNVTIKTETLQVTGDPLGDTFFIDGGTIGETGGQGGDVKIEATLIGLEHATISAGNAVAQTLGEDSTGSAGNISVSADILHLNLSTIDAGSFSLNDPRGQIGRAGNITVTAHDVQLDSSFVSAQGYERGGTIAVTSDRLILSDSEITTQTNLLPGGGIQISANAVELSRGSQLVSNTGGDGNAGPVKITAAGHFSLLEGTLNVRPTSITTTSVGTFGRGLGRGGDVTISTPHLEITSGARINTSTQSNGSAGNVSIVALDSVSISGEFLKEIPEPLFNLGNVHSSGIVSSTIGGKCSGQCGDAGQISISTGRLNLFTGGQINSGTSSSGRGGNIDIRSTNSIDLSGTLTDGSPVGIFSRSISTSPDAGPGGNISLIAGQSVTIENGASVSASSTGPGNAGNIFINAGQQLEVRDSPNAITTQAARASGGNIDIRAIDRIRFVNSTVSTSVLAEDGKGGNIFIDPNVVILEGSGVTAKAVGGAGGNITFVTPLFLADSVSLSLLSAKSESGLNGTVLIQSPISNLSGAVGQLVSKTSPPQVLLQNRCVALAGGEQSTFILAGRNTLPVEPGGWLSSPVSMEHWTGVSPEHASTLMVQSPSRRSKTWPAMITPKSEANVLSLRRLTPPGFLVRAFATPSTGCPS